MAPVTCIEIGIDPITKQWDGRGEALAYVLSKNLHRRHLSDSQRAMVADKIANLRVGRPSEIAQHCASSGAVSQTQAADMMNVGRRSVQKARSVESAARSASWTCPEPIG